MASRWIEDNNFVKNMTESTVLKHPLLIKSTEWVDDMKKWPPVEYKDNIYIQLSRAISVGIDGEAMKNYKSLDSYNYFHSLKVGAVMFHEPAADLCFLKADIIPSQAVKATKHTAWVLCNSSGAVVWKLQDALALLEEEVAAVMLGQFYGKIWSWIDCLQLEYATTSGRSGNSCTDVQQKWNQGTTRNLEAQRLENISFKRKRPSSAFDENDSPAVVNKSSLPDQPALETHEDFVSFADSSSVSKLFKLPGSLINNSYSSSPKIPSAVEDIKHSEHSDKLLCTPCKQFYQQYVHVNNKQKITLEQQTRGQSTSAVWHQARQLRITGSSAKKVPSRSTTSCENFLREHLYPSFRGNHITEHGRVNESKALQTLTEMGFRISSQGTVVSLKEPWLSASPDGITSCGALVEVKCPVLDVSVDFERMSVCDVACIEGNLELQPKGKRGYYMQVQLTMFCTGLKKCLFFVWTAQKHLLLTVPFSEDYV